MQQKKRCQERREEPEEEGVKLLREESASERLRSGSQGLREEGRKRKLASEWGQWKPEMG